MARPSRPGKGYRIFMILLLALLLACIALFVYGSVHNGLTQPSLPGQGVFAMEGVICHG